LLGATIRFQQLIVRVGLWLIVIGDYPTFPASSLPRFKPICPCASVWVCGQFHWGLSHLPSLLAAPL